MNGALQALITPPGRRDDADAAVVGAVARGFAEWESATGQRATQMKPLREVIWFYWHHPRLPRPRVSNKYPNVFPWTPAARESMSLPKRELVLEHMRPLSLLMRELIVGHDEGDDWIIQTLRGGGLDCVIVTKQEDRQITSAGLGETMWERGGDPYARYRAAGLDPQSFAQLATS